MNREQRRTQRQFNRVMRERDKKPRRRIYISPSVISTFIFLLFIGAMIYGMHQFEEKAAQVDYKTITSQAKSYAQVIEIQSEYIEEIRNDQYELSDELYKYTKDAVTTSGNEVALRVFKKEFPNAKAFKENRTQGVVKIYAFLDKYPEIKGADMVLYAIGNIDKNRIELSNKIEFYNMNVEFYRFWAKEWNNSKYIVAREGKIDEAKYPYSSLD